MAPLALPPVVKVAQGVVPALSVRLVVVVVAGSVVVVVAVAAVVLIEPQTDPVKAKDAG